jgi:hypothetical protein
MFLFEEDVIEDVGVDYFIFPKMLFGGNARMSVKLFHILSDIFYP